MRNTILISIITIHLLGNTEVNQVFRIPKLIEHYFEHARLDRHLSFMKFLSMHYGGDDGTRADDQKDNELPCHDLSHNTLSVVCLQMFMGQPGFEFITTQFVILYKNSFSPDLPGKHVLSLLRPPCA